MAGTNAGSATLTIHPALVSGFHDRVRTLVNAQTVSTNVTIDANLDLTRAHAQLAQFRVTAASNPINLRLDLDTNNAMGALVALQAQLEMLRMQILTFPPMPGGGMGGGFSMISIGASAAALAMKSLAAVSLVPLIGQVVEAAGVISLLPAAVMAAGATFATLKIGLGGVKEAFTAASAASDTTAKEWRDYGQSVEAATRGVRDSLEGVTAAEKAHQRAVRDAEQAQRSVTRARKEATEQIEDMNLALKQSSLDEEDAVLGVQEAWERLNEAKRDGSTPQQVQRADLSYRQAVQQLETLREGNQDLREEAEETNRKGVDGSDAVVAAQQALVDANDQVVESQKGISKALEQVALAQQAYNNLLEDGPSTISAYNEALAKLSPNARDFVEKTRGMSGAWDDLKMSIQDSLFFELGDKLVDLGGTYMPILSGALSNLAGILNGSLKDAMDWLMTDSTQSDISTVLDNTATALTPLLNGLGNIGRALLDLAAVGSEFLPEVTGAFESGTGSFADMIHQMRTTIDPNGQSQLHNYMQEAIDTFAQLFRIVQNIAGMATGILGGADSTGESWLDSIETATRNWAEFFGKPEGQEAVKAFFADVKAIVDGIVEGIKIAAALARPFLPKTETPAASYEDRPTVGGAPVIDQNGNVVETPAQPFVGPIAPKLGKTAFKQKHSSTTGGDPDSNFSGGIVGRSGMAGTESGRFGTDPIWNNIGRVGKSAWEGVGDWLEHPLSLGNPNATTGFEGEWNDQTRSWFGLNRAEVERQRQRERNPGGKTDEELLQEQRDRNGGMTDAEVKAAAQGGGGGSGVGQGAGRRRIAPTGTATDDPDGWREKWDGLVTSVSDGWDKEIAPRWESLTTKVGEIGQGFLDDITGTAGGAWSGLSTSVQERWDNTIAPAWNTLRTEGLGGLANDFVSKITDGAVLNWEDLPSHIGSGVARIVTEHFPGLSGALDTLSTKFGTIVDAIGTVWDGLKAKVQEPINWIIKNVLNDGIGKAWNAVHQLLGLPEWPTIDSVGETGQSGGFNKDIQKKAVGGPVFGAGGPTEDKVPAWLSNGEHVWTAAEVASAGGHSAVERMRKGAAAGRLANYRDGGAVGPRRYALGGDTVLASEADTWMARVIQDAFPEVTVTSGYRPGHSGFHGKAQAIDIDGPNKQAYADWIFSAFPQSEQLIWGPGPLLFNVGGQSITDQAQLANQVYADDLPGHFDHVHWANDTPLGDLTPEEKASVFERIKNGLGAVFSTGRNALGGQIADLFEGPVKALGSTIPDFPELGMFGDVPKALYDKVSQAALDMVRGKAEIGRASCRERVL